MFPGPTLLSAATSIIESALNRALALDPAGKQALMSALTGPVQFSLDGLGLTLTLQQAGDRIQVASQPSEAPALILSGRPMAFAALATGDDGVFSEGRIHVTGDTALAHQFHAQRGKHGLQLGELALVVGCQYEFHSQIMLF